MRLILIAIVTVSHSEVTFGRRQTKFGGVSEEAPDRCWVRRPSTRAALCSTGLAPLLCGRSACTELGPLGRSPEWISAWPLRSGASWPMPRRTCGASSAAARLAVVPIARARACGCGRCVRARACGCTPLGHRSGASSETPPNLLVGAGFRCVADLGRWKVDPSRWKVESTRWDVHPRGGMSTRHRGERATGCVQCHLALIGADTFPGIAEIDVPQWPVVCFRAFQTKPFTQQLQLTGPRRRPWLHSW